MIKSIPAALFALAFAMNSEAYLVDADPANFASGTDISNAFEGVKLSSYNVAPILSFQDWYYGLYTPVVTETPIYSYLCSPCASYTEGQAVFSSTGTDPWFYSSDNARGVIAEDPATYSGNSYRAYGINAFMARFDDGTDYFQLVGGGNRTSDFYMADLWDTEGEYIGRCVGGLVTEPNQNSTPCEYELLGDAPYSGGYTNGQWLFTYSDPDRKVGMITSGGFAGNQYVRSLAFSVPEPSTWAITILPLTLLAGIHRRRRRTAN